MGRRLALGLLGLSCVAAAQTPTGHPQLERWPEKVALAMDTSALSGLTLARGTSVYAVRIVDGAGGPAFIHHHAGEGAFSQNYWPASAVKVLAAIAAAERLNAELGMNGDATVHYGLGGAYDYKALREAYTASITVSSNEGYSRTLQVAGATWINTAFFRKERGFPQALLQRTYVVGDAYNAIKRPELTFEQGAKKVVEPARVEPKLPMPPGCSGDGLANREQNCMSLFEMTEGLRRVMLDGEVRPFERFALHARDLGGIQSALCSAVSPYFKKGADLAYGGTKRNCHKTGFVPGYHCLDHAFIETTNNQRLLVAAATPYPTSGTCTGVMEPLGERVLPRIARADAGVPLQHDHGDLSVRWTYASPNAQIEFLGQPGTRSELWVGPQRLDFPTHQASTSQALAANRSHLLVARSFNGSAPVAYRALIVRPAEGRGCDDTAAANGCDGDGGTQVPDAGTQTDGGTPGPDAGPADAGTSEEDGGVEPVDAGEQPPDSGEETGKEPGESTPGVFGCSAGAGLLPLAWLGALLALGRRRPY